MLENRSIDQMLGALNNDLPGLDGVNDLPPGVNIDSKGNVYKQLPYEEDLVSPDPKHELEHVHYQQIQPRDRRLWDTSRLVI